MENVNGDLVGDLETEVEVRLEGLWAVGGRELFGNRLVADLGDIKNTLIEKLVDRYKPPRSV